MSWSENQANEARELTTGWSVTCCVIATVTALSAGNVPMTVIAMSVAAADLSRRMARRMMNRKHEAIKIGGFDSTPGKAGTNVRQDAAGVPWPVV